MCCRRRHGSAPDPDNVNMHVPPPHTHTHQTACRLPPCPLRPGRPRAHTQRDWKQQGRCRGHCAQNSEGHTRTCAQGCRWLSARPQSLPHGQAGRLSCEGTLRPHCWVSVCCPHQPQHTHRQTRTRRPSVLFPHQQQERGRSPYARETVFSRRSRHSPTR